jgi:hypothetical protein
MKKRGPCGSLIPLNGCKGTTFSQNHQIFSEKNTPKSSNCGKNGLEAFFLVSWHDNVVITNGVRQEVRGLLFVAQSDHLLRAAEVRFRQALHQLTLGNEMA